MKKKDIEIDWEVCPFLKTEKEPKKLLRYLNVLRRCINCAKWRKTIFRAIEARKQALF